MNFGKNERIGLRVKVLKVQSVKGAKSRGVKGARVSGARGMDFYCHEQKLVIEIDGDIHLEET